MHKMTFYSHFYQSRRKQNHGVFFPAIWYDVFTNVLRYNAAITFLLLSRALEYKNKTEDLFAERMYMYIGTLNKFAKSSE